MEEQRKSTCYTMKKSSKIFMKYVLLRALRLTLYSLDLSSDVVVAYSDFKEGKTVYSLLTIGFVFAPATCFALYMFCEAIWKYKGELSCMRGLIWLILVPILPFWPVLRDIKQISMGITATFSKNRREKIIKKLDAPSKVYLIKFLEAFTEAAPQLVVRLLKISINNPFQFTNIRLNEIIQISFSLLMMSLIVVSTHQKNISTKQVLDGELEDMQVYQLGCISQITAVFWWLCFLFTRIQAMTLFASSYTYWIFFVLLLHAGLMLLLQTVSVPKDAVRKFFIYVFGALIFTFAYVKFNLSSKVKIPPWVTYTIFTVIVFVENAVMLTCWFYKQRTLIDFYMQNGTENHMYNMSILSFNNDSISSGNTTYLDNKNSMIMHWEKLILVHYSVFGASVIFMILTLCTTAYKRESNRDEEEEMDTCVTQPFPTSTDD